jgi:hypothetical protein
VLSRLPCWQQIQLGTVGTPDPEKNLHKISSNTKTCRVDMTMHICILHSMLLVNKNRYAPVKYNWKCRLDHRQLREMPESALHIKKIVQVFRVQNEQNSMKTRYYKSRKHSRSHGYMLLNFLSNMLDKPLTL